jgi:hypothetical protein
MTTTAEAAPIELLTASRMRAFRDCARLHQLKYVEGWRPVETSEALRFGTLVHVGLEAYWNAIRDGAPTLLAAHAAMDGRAYDAFEQVRAEEMLRAYSNRWEASDFDAYEVLAVEAQFETFLLNPETFAPSRTWRLAGKIDAIVRRRSDGRDLVIEHKTSSENVSADDADYWTKLAIDPQISEYTLGAESLGYDVDEVLYDVLGKPTQRPKKATPVEDRKFTKDGRLYATQRELDETPEEYRARVREAIEAQPERFTARRSIPRSEAQIRDFMADAWALAATMRESVRLGRAPRNPDACDRYGRCPMWNLCSTGARPEDYPGDYVRSSDKHPELGGETK